MHIFYVKTRDTQQVFFRIVYAGNSSFSKYNVDNKDKKMLAI